MSDIAVREAHEPEIYVIDAVAIDQSIDFLFTCICKKTTGAIIVRKNDMD